MQPIILVVDDDSGIRMLYAAVCSRLGYAVCSAGSVAHAREVLRDCNPTAVVLDVRLPDGNGLELVPHIREAGDPPVIFASAASTQRELALFERYAFRVLPKPFDIIQLQEAIGAACTCRRTKRALEAH